MLNGSSTYGSIDDDFYYFFSSSGNNLSQLGRIIPGNMKEVNINTRPLKELAFTHLVVRVKPSDDKVSLALNYNISFHIDQGSL